MCAAVARAALALLLVLPACASRGGAQEDASPAPDEPVMLAVVNHTWSDADIFVQASTIRARLGNVASLGTVDVVVPRDVWAYGAIQVRVEPIGGTPYVTDGIDVHGGQRITVTVEEQRGLSSWVVEKLRRW